MTLYGKILVLANFGLSVIVLVCAMMIYFEHIDWTLGPEKPPEQKGELRKRNEKVSELWDGIGLAEKGWREVHADLQEEEGYRAADGPWYEKELDQARNLATEKDPARTVVFDKGVLVLEPVANEPKHQRPKMEAAKDDLGRPLASLKSYNAAEGKTRDELNAKQKELTDQFEKDKELTNRLTPEDGKKGLRARIEDEKGKIKLVDTELVEMQQLRVNATVDNDLIGRRDKELVKRIEELKKSLGLPVAAK